MKHLIDFIDGLFSILQGSLRIVTDMMILLCGSVFLIENQIVVGEFLRVLMGG